MRSLLIYESADPLATRSDTGFAVFKGDTPGVRAFRALHDVTKRLHASLDITETLDSVARGVVAHTGFAVAVINLFQPDGFFEAVSVEGDAKCREVLLGTRQTVEMWARLAACAERWGDTLHFIDYREAAVWNDGGVSYSMPIESSNDPCAWHADDALFAILTAPSGERVGVISVDGPIDGLRPSVEQLELLELFADHAAIAIHHANMHSALKQNQDELRHAATHDSLTGLANRALFNVEAALMAARPKSRLAVLVIDLDGFKRVNDLAGHQAGDEVLVALAERMRRSIRAGTLLARTGGDEFVIALTGDEIDEAVIRLIRRLEEIICEPIRTTRGPHHVGASIGAAIASTPADLSAVLSEADAHMYARKRSRAPIT